MQHGRVSLPFIGDHGSTPAFLGAYRRQRPCALALRADWQEQLRRCHEELGFRHVRFHGLLCDDVGILVDERDQLLYSFFNADQIWDFLLSIGMKPFIELSFMPTTLASGGTTIS